ncbi:hypothetical protein ACFL0I_00205 [Gemmatimonadota bacterium]
MARHGVLLLGLGSVFLFVTLLTGCGSKPGVGLTLENAGDEALESVVILTTGFSYPIGDLDPGEVFTIEVEARSDSHIVLEHGSSERRRLVVNVYLQRGYTGELRVQVNRDSVIDIENNMEIG